jgi:predicted transcriptional regulator
MTNFERVAECLRNHPSYGQRKIAKELRLSHTTVFRILKKIRGQTNSEQEEVKSEISDGHQSLVSVSPNIKTLDDLLNYCEVDRAEWEVERFIINKWEVGAKVNDVLIAKPLFQVKAWLRQRKDVLHLKKVMDGLLEAFKRPEYVTRGVGSCIEPQPKRVIGCNALELSIFDLHFGKLCWGPEVGTHYDMKIAKSTFSDAVEALLERSKGFEIGQVVMPIGNDFFNSDNARGTTTAGTPQDNDGRWQKSFLDGRKMMVQSIERIAQVAPVHVVIVTGNHDTERMFYLGDVLSAWFRNLSNVHIDNSPAQRKYFKWGKCLLGFTHGNNEKHTNLPLIMATEQPQLWADSKFREFHLGHWHSKKEIHFQPVIEQNGIRVRVIPSLCPSDAWHKTKGYEGLRSAEAFVWHPTQGNIAQFSHTPNDTDGN